jgi:hypothetical protein
MTFARNWCLDKILSKKKIGNIIKDYSIQKPDPKISEHTHPDKPWIMPFIEYKSM